MKLLLKVEYKCLEIKYLKKIFHFFLPTNIYILEFIPLFFVL